MPVLADGFAATGEVCLGNGVIENDEVLERKLEVSGKSGNNDDGGMSDDGDGGVD